VIEAKGGDAILERDSIHFLALLGPKRDHILDNSWIERVSYLHGK
jgi:hypothetical protein